MTTTTVTHFHVLAVQDWGGTQEYWAAWEEKRTRAEAEQLARDAADADRPNREGWYEGMPTYDDLEAKYQPKYGDDWHDLMSSNVNPGWEAVFIRPCDQAGECDPYEGVHFGQYKVLGDPWWTPGMDAADNPHAHAPDIHDTTFCAACRNDAALPASPRLIGAIDARD